MSEKTKTEQVQNDNDGANQQTEPIKAEEKPVKIYSEAEYNALKSQLDSLKQSTKDNEDFKKKFEQSEQARKDFEHKTKISAYVKSLGLKDDIYEKHVENLLLEKGLKFENDKLIGGDDIIKSFKESHADAFKSEKPQPFTAPTGNGGNSTLTGIEKAFFNLNPNLKA
jgi:hypothetical protein